MSAFKVLVKLPNEERSRWVTMISRENTLELARKAAEVYFTPERIVSVVWLHEFRNEDNARREKHVVVD